MSTSGSNHLRGAVWEWTQVALLIGNLWWTTLCLGGYRPETMVVTSGLTGALVVVHLLGWWASNITRLAETGSGRYDELAGPRLAVDQRDHEPPREGQCPSPRFHPAGWLMLVFLVYAAANVIWVTPVRWLGWLDWLGWAQLIAVFWVVLNGVRSRGARGMLLGALVVLGFVAVGLAVYQRFAKPDWLMLGRTQAAQYLGRSSGPFGSPNSLAALLILLLPPLLALTVRRGANAVQRVLCGYLALVFAFGLVLTISRGAWLSLLLALALWPVALGRGSWTRRLLLTLVVTGTLLAAGFALSASAPAIRDRLQTLKRDSGEITRPIMWRGAWQIFREHPLWGGGAGSYNVLFEKFRPERFQDEPHWAHNEYLNTLSDYGVVGFATFFGGWGAIAWGCPRRRRRTDGASAGEGPARATRRGVLNVSPAKFGERGEGRTRWIDDPTFLTGLTVGLAAFGFQLFVDLHFRIPGLTMVFGTIAALRVQSDWPLPGVKDTNRGAVQGTAWGVAFATVIVVAGTVWLVLPFTRGEARRFVARQAIDGIARRGIARMQWRPLLTEARGDLTRAVELAPTNASAWADLAYATALWGHVEPERTMELGREAERAADRALAISRVDPVFWVRRGVALDLQGRWREAGTAFDEAVRLAPARAGIWYNYAFHLSLDPSTWPRAKSAVDFCLRLDGGNREAQALRQRLADHTRVP